MSILTDNFNDNSRDTVKWALGAVGFENAAVGVAEANGQVEITPIANEASPAIYGYKSAAIHNFSGLEARVRIAADFGSPSEAWLVVALDNDNYLRIWAVGGGNIFTRSRVGASNANEDHGSFTFATHTHWKIRHDKVTDEIVFEYSSDGLSWTQLRRIARPFSITTSTIYLSGGSGSSAATPPVIKFDDLIVQGSQSPSLFRGRNLPFFDDDEVNRFEFWPAIATATVHERSAAIDSAGSIASTGEFFSVFERTTTLDAAGDIATAGVFFSIFERSTAVSASTTIETLSQFFSTSERSIAIDANAAVATAGVRVVERPVSIESSAAVNTSGESFTLFESAASFTVAASLDASGISFSVFEGAVSVDASASITTIGLRIVERSSALTASAAIESNAVFFSIAERAAQIDAAGAIESSAEFFSVFERALSLSVTGEIVTSGQREIFRSVLIDGAGSITVSGLIFSATYDRAVAINATGLINAAGVRVVTFNPRQVIGVGSEIRQLAVSRENRTIPIGAEQKSI